MTIFFDSSVVEEGVLGNVLDINSDLGGDPELSCLVSEEL